MLDLLRQVGDVSDANILAAGLLHDTVEDAGTTAEELEERFGAKIASLILSGWEGSVLRSKAMKSPQPVQEFIDILFSTVLKTS